MNILNKQIDSIYDRQKNIRIIANRMQKVKRYANKKNHSNIWKGCIGYHKRR